MLGASKLSLRQGFRRRRKHLYGASAPPARWPVGQHEWTVFLFGFRSRWSLHPSVFLCSGQVNCPSAKVFAAGENACTAQSAAGQKAGLSPLCIAFHLNCNRTRCRWASIWFWVQNWGLALILLRDSKKSCCKIRFSGQKEKFIYEKSEREPPLRRFSLTLSLVLFL